MQHALLFPLDYQSGCVTVFEENDEVSLFVTQVPECESATHAEQFLVAQKSERLALYAVVYDQR